VRCDRSLCIIDEFGKGTLASDGVGLLCAALQHLADQRPLPPKVIACTHFSEMMHGGHLRRRARQCVPGRACAAERSRLAPACMGAVAAGAPSWRS